MPNHRLYIGTYTRPAGHVPNASGRGILTYDFDSDTGALTYVTEMGGIDCPSYLALSPDGRNLYATSEISTWQESVLAAYAVDAATGALRYLNMQPTHGAFCTYVTVDHSGACVVGINYGGEYGVAVFPRLVSGALAPASSVHQHTGSGPNRARQEAPHGHCAVFDPTNRYALICDLGTDQVLIYRFDPVRALLTRHNDLHLEGSGPRHLVFHPNGRWVYLIQELSGSITSLMWDAAAGALTPINTVSILPDDYQGARQASAVHVSADGRFVYGANRQHDSLAVCRVNDDGSLARTAIVPAGGATPRDFALDPTGRWLLVAHQDGDTVATFRVDPASGIPQPTGQVTPVGTPVCLLFAG